MNIPLQPWLTPNFVHGVKSVRGNDPAPCWPLSQVPDSELNRMCREFRAEVFRKAGKADLWDQA